MSSPRFLRLQSLDVFRGLTIALMILVNSPGSKTTYAWLEHAAWNGCTFADLVFPFFIIIVGISAVLALSNLSTKGIEKSRLFKKVILRSAYIFLVGLLLNAFPHHFDFTTIRILGVLQRIAICYLVSALCYLTVSARTQAWIAAGLLLSYWFIMRYFMPLTPDANLAGFVDQWLFSPGHLYTPTFDPEGILSTMPAIASVLIGNLIGYHLLSSASKPQQLHWMITTGLMLAAAGWLWHFDFPLNKALWSSAYVLWTAGLALLVFAGCYQFIEIKQWTRWSKPFHLFGRNAMLVYVLHVMFLKIQSMIHVTHTDGTLVNLREHLTAICFAHLSPHNASLAYAISYTALWLLVLTVINRYRQGRAARMFHTHRPSEPRA